jgi:hypothetical protein
MEECIPSSRPISIKFHPKEKKKGENGIFHRFPTAAG